MTDERRKTRNAPSKRKSNLNSNRKLQLASQRQKPNSQLRSELSKRNSLSLQSSSQTRFARRMQLWFWLISIECSFALLRPTCAACIHAKQSTCSGVTQTASQVPLAARFVPRLADCSACCVAKQTQTKQSSKQSSKQSNNKAPPNLFRLLFARSPHKSRKSRTLKSRAKLRQTQANCKRAVCVARRSLCARATQRATKRSATQAALVASGGQSNIARSANNTALRSAPNATIPRRTIQTQRKS